MIVSAMTLALILLAILGSGAVTTALLLRAGLPKGRAWLVGIAVAIAAAVVLVAMFLTAFGECLGENGDPRPATWPWSPRREFCEPGSGLGLKAAVLMLVPAVFATLGAYLVDRGHLVLGRAFGLALLALPAVPSIYLNSLAEYRLDSYPILQRPLLRPASQEHPARVCYVYGIYSGPRRIPDAADPHRTCVDLKPTPTASALTTEYDEGSTIYDLDWMGKKLTEKGLPVRPGESGVAGLAVTRAYRLSGPGARRGAKLVD